MDELIKTFHIETSLLLAQMVNFVIVLAVLYKFAYKPILKTLNERTEKIQKGIVDAEESQKKLENAAQKEKEILKQARRESQEIIKKAEESAKKNQEMIAVETKSQSEKIILDARKQIELEKDKLIREIKGEIADLVILATGKIIGEKISTEKDQEIIKQAIEK